MLDRTNITPEPDDYERFAALLERRIADLSQAHETRVVALRESITSVFVEQIVELKKELADLRRSIDQQKTIDSKVTEISDKLDARAAARQIALAEIRRGPPGHRGVPGATGPAGKTGARGPKGVPGMAAPTISAWHIDQKTFTVRAILSDGTTLKELDLRPLFEGYHAEVYRQDSYDG